MQKCNPITYMFKINPILKKDQLLQGSYTSLEGEENGRIFSLSRLIQKGASFLYGFVFNYV